MVVRIYLYTHVLKCNLQGLLVHNTQFVDFTFEDLKRFQKGIQDSKTASDPWSNYVKHTAASILRCLHFQNIKPITNISHFHGKTYYVESFFISGNYVLSFVSKILRFLWHIYIQLLYIFLGILWK